MRVCVCSVGSTVECHAGMYVMIIVVGFRSEFMLSRVTNPMSDVSVTVWPMIGAHLGVPMTNIPPTLLSRSFLFFMSVAGGRLDIGICCM
jgi:hypothetical protein